MAKKPKNNYWTQIDNIGKRHGSLKKAREHLKINAKNALTQVLIYESKRPVAVEIIKGNIETFRNHLNGVYGDRGWKLGKPVNKEERKWKEIYEVVKCKDGKKYLLFPTLKRYLTHEELEKAIAKEFPGVRRSALIYSTENEYLYVGNDDLPEEE